MEIGEHWAYRERAFTEGYPVVPVEILQFGPTRSRKVRVRFLDGEYAGLDQWVTRRRLKVPWAEAEAWLRDERSLMLARDASVGIGDSLHHDAVKLILYACPPANSILPDWPDAGVVTVSDLDTTARDLRLDPDELRGLPESFTSRAGEYVAPWSVAEPLARRIAERMPDLVLAEVTEEESELRETAVHGDATGYRGRDERAAEAYALRLREREPVFEIVREWRGQQAVDRYEEVEALRDEVRGLRDLVLETATRLDGLGERRAANRLRAALDHSPDSRRST